MRSTKSRILTTLICGVLVLTGCAVPGKKGTSSTADKADGKSQSVKVDKSTQSSFDRAVTMMKSGNHAGAIPLLEEITNAEPKLAAPYANLGIAYLQTNRLNDAEKAFEKATALNPKHAPYWNYLGITLRQTGKFNEAQTAYNKALQADPEYGDAHLNLGILQDLYLKNPTAALTHYQAYQAQANPKDKQVDKWIADLEKRTKSTAPKSKGTTP